MTRPAPHTVAHRYRRQTTITLTAITRIMPVIALLRLAMAGRRGRPETGWQPSVHAGGGRVPAPEVLACWLRDGRRRPEPDRI